MKSKIRIIHCKCGRTIKAIPPCVAECKCGRLYIYKVRSNRYILAKE